jgi:hypothetical protein
VFPRDFTFSSVLIRSCWIRWLFKLVKDDDDDENDGADGRIHTCVFRWTGKNHYFALCESDFISFGGGYVHVCLVLLPHPLPHLLVLLVPALDIPNLTPSPLIIPNWLSLTRSRDGRYGLWIDKNLYHGSSAPCPAYDNEVLCAPPGDTAQRGNFECYGLEVWATS